MDFSADLVGGYAIHRTSGHQVQISPGAYEPTKTPIIPTKVLMCITYERLILAKRQGLKRRSPNDPNDLYEEPDPDVIDYWILDTSVPQVFGPMSLEQFKAKRLVLRVPESAKLKDVDEFRP